MGAKKRITLLHQRVDHFRRARHGVQKAIHGSSQWCTGLISDHVARDSSALDPETTGRLASISAGCITKTLSIHDDTSIAENGTRQKLQGYFNGRASQATNASVDLALAVVGIQIPSSHSY